MRTKNSQLKFPIDLSMLTELEIDQFRDDPTTLYEGVIDVVLYLRFSSERQREQSIEGQLRDCIAYCKAHHYRIVAIYERWSMTAAPGNGNMSWYGNLTVLPEIAPTAQCSNSGSGKTVSRFSLPPKISLTTQRVSF